MFRSNFPTKHPNGNHSTTHHLLSSLVQNPLSFPLIRFRLISFFSSSSSFEISTKNLNISTFVVSYLVNSCGLQNDKAISASKKLHFKTSSKPDSVLTFLQTRGFTKPYIAKIITKCPLLLSTDPQKTLKPKFDFFNSVGLSGLDLVTVLSKDPFLLIRASFDKQIIPTFDFYKSILQSDEKVVTAIKSSSRFLKLVQPTELVSNIELLRLQSVPETLISTYLMLQPCLVSVNSEKFKEIVEEIKGMGFDPSKCAYLQAIHALAAISKPNWEQKLNVFREWGWSEDDILTAFKKQPWFMRVSVKKITKVLDFFVKQMGYNSSCLARHPHVFMYSLEKRTIPRFRVIHILVTNCLISENISISTVVSKTKKLFLEIYVNKYEKEIPLLLEAYQGHLEADIYQDESLSESDHISAKCKLLD